MQTMELVAGLIAESGAPLLGQEDVIVVDAERPALDAQLLVFARELGELSTLDRQRRHQLDRALRVIEETLQATLRALATVVEAKDLETHGHLERTQAYGLALTRQIDPALAEAPGLGHGFFLHDIGKVGIPDRILGKCGSLSKEEWAVMRTHPVIGTRIVKPFPFLGDAVAVIRHHHERFDGRGYPDGLRGDRIPLGARIFAVADAFDAMVSDRPYRAALPEDRALDQIERGAGSQFDPEVVDAFLGMFRREDPLGFPVRVDCA